MAQISIDPKQLKPKPLDEGWYGAVIHKAEIDTAPDTIKASSFRKPGDQELALQFRIEDLNASDDFQGRMLFERHCLEPGRGDRFLRFAYSIDLTDEDLKTFDPDDLNGLPVEIKITQTLGKMDPATGERPVYNNVREVKRLTT